MAHDELLEQVSDYISSECDCESCNFINGPYKALRAVVKLITKEDTIPLDDYHFGYMAACKDIYEAIEKELNAESIA